MKLPTLKEAKKILAAAYGDNAADYNQIEIDCDLENIENEIHLLGEDIFFLDVPLDPDVYNLETDWADAPCIIGESGGNSTRTVVYYNPKACSKNHGNIDVCLDCGWNRNDN